VNLEPDNLSSYDAVRKEYGDLEIIRLLVTHYATKAFMREAKRVLVIQSFEWC
jgi:hypothetical protein